MRLAALLMVMLTPLGRPQGAADLVGRLHPAVVHFPIAWLFLLLAVEAGGLALRRERWPRAGLVLLIGTLVAFLGAIVTGFIRESWLHADGTVARLVEIHRLTMFSTADVLLAALAVRLIGGRRAWARWGYLGLLVIAAVLVVVAADSGARAAYGPDYLF